MEQDHAFKQPLPAWARPMVVIAAICLVGLMIFVQQFLGRLSQSSLSVPPADIARSEELLPSGFSGLTIDSKYLIKALRHPDYAEGVEKEQIDEMLTDLASQAVSPVDRLRLAIVKAEIKGGEAVRSELTTLRDALTPDGDLQRDADWLLRLYAAGKGGGEQIDRPVRESLIDRHGWFGTLAVSYGLDDGNPLRKSVLEGLDAMMAAERWLFLLRFAFFGIGCFAAIGLTVLLIRGQLTGSFDAAHTAPEKQWVYLEALCVFEILLCFAILLIIPFRGAGVSAAAVGVTLREVMAWACVVAGLWPILRGVPREFFALDIGWHTGDGWWEEIKAGILVYAATLPILILISIGWALAFDRGDSAGAEATEKFPMFRDALEGSTWVAVMSILGAVLWAPFVEEVIYRGMLYRFLHRRVGMVLAVVISSLAFGLTHPYDLQGLIDVSIGGVIYALLREWRSSLIAPITAHMLHNGFIALQTLVLMIFL